MTPYLTTSEAAHLLRCSPATIRAMIADGELAAIRMPSRWLIDAADLPKPERIERAAFQTPMTTIRRRPGVLVDIVQEIEARRG